MAKPAGARRAGPAPRSRRATRRYAVPYDTAGPRVRLGVVWFLAAGAALAVGPLPAAIVYGGVAAVAAAQSARCWRRGGARPNEVVAAGMAGAMAAGAVLGAAAAGVALLAGVVVAGVVAGGDRKSPHPIVVDVGWTIQCGLFPGLVGLSMVLLDRFDQGSALALLVLVSAYEIGDYVVGSGARTPYEGPAAGLVAVVVVTFVLSATPVYTLSFSATWIFGSLVAIGAPAGQLVASALLPTAAGPASALRRIDSLLLVGPAWCWGIGLVL